MKTISIAYVVTLAAFGLLDFFWLSRMADVLYRPTMGDMVASGFKLAPAVLFYLIFCAGLVYFAVRPAIGSGDWSVAFVQGAVLGCVAYATYDLTNQATLKNWSTTLTLADMAWGTVLSAVSATIGYFVTQMIARTV